MSINQITLTAGLLIAALTGGACGVAKSREDKVIASKKAGDMLVSVASASGEIRNGENELFLTFTDGSGKLVDVGAASLRFHMPAMIGMAEMNDTATLTTTETAGRYRAQVTIQAAGTWEAIVGYDGAHGKGQARMTVNAR